MTEEELKEKIIVLQNFHRVKDKKIKNYEEERKRHNILIDKQKQEIKILQKRIDKAIEYIENNKVSISIKPNSKYSIPIEHLLEILKGSDKEWVTFG